MSKRLFDDDGSSESETELKISNKYAERYDSWREKEELQKLEAKYGKDAAYARESVGADDESSSDEDDEAEEITPAMERQFFTTLAQLKQNDPAIYQQSTKFFEPISDTNGMSQKKTKKEKPMLLRDYEREMLLSATGADGSVDGCESSKAGISSGVSGSYAQEQEDIRAGFRRVLQDSDDDEDSKDDPFAKSLLRKRERTDAEKQTEEEDYKAWLAGHSEKCSAQPALEQRLTGLRRAWTDPNISKDEAFLRDYILNKCYLGEGDDSYIPGYDEVVHDSEEDLSADERTLGQQENFETKFNFRFEEPDQQFIKRYPRTISSSMRKKNERRKKAREEKRARKETETERRQQELMRLRALKRKQLLEKLETLKEVVGNEELPFEEADLEADFDPEAHDQKMSTVFSDQFYCDGDLEEEKPQFSDEGDDPDWDNYNPAEDTSAAEEYDNGEDCQANDYNQPRTFGSGQTGIESSDLPACEQPGFVMDCDFDPNAGAAISEESGGSRRQRRRRARRGPLAQVLRRKKPCFQSDGQQTLEQYIEQYFSLDQSLLPHPFKYRKTEPNDFGLNTEEVLMADERELNRWVSVRRMSQYVRPEQEHSDIKRYRAKSANTAYKQKIFQSLYTTEEAAATENPDEYIPPQKKKKQKRKKHRHDEETGADSTSVGQQGGKSAASNNNSAGAASAELVTTPSDPSSQLSGKKKKKRQSQDVANESEPSPSTNYHSGEKKKRRGNGSEKLTTEGAGLSPLSITLDCNEKKNKKKKKRQNEDQMGEIESSVSTNYLSAERKRRNKSETKEGINEDVELNTSSVPRDSTGKKKKNKKQRQSVEDTVFEMTESAPSKPKQQSSASQQPFAPQQKNQNKKRLRSNKAVKGTPAHLMLTMSDSRLEAFGMNPRKVRGKILYGKP